MPLDPRTPVLVGVGQWSNRVDRGEPVVEPADLLAGALRRAGDDSGAPGGGEALLRGALESCERYYQSFQFVLWAGKSCEDALAATMLETHGQA